jgi:hypothetical protein
VDFHQKWRDFFDKAVHFSKLRLHFMCQCSLRRSMTMLRVMNHKWFRGILVSAALLVPLGYVGLRNGFATAQVGTPITPGSSVDTTIAPSPALSPAATTPATTNLSVGSTTSIDPTASPTSGLSTSPADAQDTHAMSTDDSADTHVALNADEDDTDLVEMAAADGEDVEETIAEEDTEDHGLLISQDDADAGSNQIADRSTSEDDQ